MSTPLTPEERTELRALAAEATPGPWYAAYSFHGDPCVCTDKERGSFTAVAIPSTAPEDYGKANCEYIAAASPDKVEALLDQVEAYEAELAALREGKDDARSLYVVAMQLAEEASVVPPEFWRGIVTDGEGRWDLNQVCLELADYQVLLDNVPTVYDDLTGGRISKPNTPAAAVIAEHDENCYFKRESDEQEAELAALRTAAQEYLDASQNPTWVESRMPGDGPPAWRHKPQREALAAALGVRPEDGQQ